MNLEVLFFFSFYEELMRISVLSSYVLDGPGLFLDVRVYYYSVFLIFSLFFYFFTMLDERHLGILL